MEFRSWISLVASGFREAVLLRSQSYPGVSVRRILQKPISICVLCAVFSLFGEMSWRLNAILQSREGTGKVILGLCTCVLDNRKKQDRRDTMPASTWQVHRNWRWGEYTGLPGWALHAITNVLVRRRQRESTDRRKGKMTTKAERGATHPQAKEFQPPELGEAGNSFSSEPAEGAQPCPHCDFGPVELISDFRPPELLREEICVVF